MPNMKGGEYIVDFLIREGVPYVFGVCGHGNVGILDAMYERQSEIKLISPRHEQTAGHMADAYWRVRHAPVATLTSCGPGSVNMMLPLANAFLDSSAYLAITANVPTQHFGLGAFQEIYRHQPADFPSSVKPYVKRCLQPTRVDMLPLAMRQAMTVATSGRPGPVCVDVPYNVFQEADDVSYEPSNRHALAGRPGASSEEIRRIADLLYAAEKPLIYVGHGVALSEASAELVELVQTLQFPVGSMPNGMGVVDARDPLYVGHNGRNGAYQANQAGRHCDVLLAVGVHFDDRSSSSWLPGYSWNIPPTKLIHVDIDPGELGRAYPVEVGVIADARTFLRQLLEEVGRRSAPDPARTAAWRAEIQSWKSEWERFLAPKFEESASPATPEGIVRDVRNVLRDDGILVLDVGAHHNWFVQLWEARRPQSMLNAFGFGAMGFGTSGALGAKLAAPERQCVAVVGDGSFMMTPHVVATAVEYNIAVVWVVWNNFGWTSIRDIQLGMFQGRELGTLFYKDGERYNPDFAMMARAAGCDGITVTHNKDFAGALEHALGLGKPCLIDAHVDGDIRPVPTGASQYPPMPEKTPAYGERFLPESMAGE